MTKHKHDDVNPPRRTQKPDGLVYVVRTCSCYAQQHYYEREDGSLVDQNPVWAFPSWVTDS